MEKGYVEYEVQGRNNFYKPRIGKTEYGKKSVNQLVKGYFEGSAAKLVSQFVSDNKLSMKKTCNIYCNKLRTLKIPSP